MNLPPFRDPKYVERKVEVEHRADGSILLRNPHPLRDAPANLIEPLRKWAVEAPDRVWLGRRKASGQGFGAWERLTYADAERKTRAIAQALLDRGLDASSPVMILSGNSIEHALMTYGAILAGIPVAPVSPSYSTMSSDFDKLRYVFDLVQPKLIFMQDARWPHSRLTVWNASPPTARTAPVSMHSSPRNRAGMSSRAMPASTAIWSRNIFSPPAPPACPRPSSPRSA